MASKSIRHIVESTVATYLAAQTDLTTVTFLTGDSAATQTLPKAVVLCESARAPGDLPEGLGNYSCSVRITLFSNADDTTLADHRLRCAAIVGNMRDLTSIKAAFTATGDASCYDVTIGSEDEGVDERSWATSFSFDLLTVFPA
ncbi:MAG: hypothetical protein EBR99_01865 [Actinobacteria bacterium]|nr:hypothetical protein [Actinomycetota bacterium]